MTTTDWQAYSGETTLSYLSQMQPGWQNFVAAAVGLAPNSSCCAPERAFSPSRQREVTQIAWHKDAL
jgi:K+-transporting ATPase A subunit